MGNIFCKPSLMLIPFWVQLICQHVPCMVYLPTFGLFLGLMLVNIPYIEYLGMSTC